MANTDLIDISKYKCVPLDILRNISDTDQVQFTVNSQNTSLKDFKASTDEATSQAGPLLGGNNRFNADTIENIIIGFCVAFGILLGVIILFYFGLNFSTYGTSVIGIPPSLRGLPVIAIASFLFLLLGFLIGYFVK